MVGTIETNIGKIFKKTVIFFIVIVLFLNTVILLHLCDVKNK